MLSLILELGREIVENKITKSIETPNKSDNIMDGIEKKKLVENWLENVDNSGEISENLSDSGVVSEKSLVENEIKTGIGNQNKVCEG